MRCLSLLAPWLSGVLRPGVVGGPADRSGESPSDGSPRWRPLSPRAGMPPPLLFLTWGRRPWLPTGWGRRLLSPGFPQVGDTAPCLLTSAPPAGGDHLPGSLHPPAGISRQLSRPDLLHPAHSPSQKRKSPPVFSRRSDVTGFKKKKSSLGSQRLPLSLSWESYFWVLCWTR